MDKGFGFIPWSSTTLSNFHLSTDIPLATAVTDAIDPIPAVLIWISLMHAFHVFRTNLPQVSVNVLATVPPKRCAELYRRPPHPPPPPPPKKKKKKKGDQYLILN